MTQTFSPQTLFSARQDLISSALSETEMVMMNLDKGAYYGLEEVAKLVWDHLSEPRSLDDLCALVLENYVVEPEQVEQDLPVFLDELIELELIQVQDGR